MNSRNELHWLVISTTPQARNLYILFKYCNILFILNIVLPQINYIGFPSRLHPLLPAESLDSVPSTEVKGNLSRQKSCWMQLHLALLTEAILMFYWFFWFIFFCPSLHIHALALSLPWGTAKQAKTPSELWSRSPRTHIRLFPKQQR